VRIVIIVPTRRRSVVAVLLLAIALAVPSGVLANHLFSDVPNSSPFHGDIAAIGLAGITAGCGGGKFCPSSTLTRAQEAAFLHRGLGRVASDVASSVTVPAAALTTVTEATIVPGLVDGVAGANGFLKIDGSVTLYEGNPDQCICSISIRAYVDGVAVPGTSYVFLPSGSVFEAGSASISVVVPVTTGTKTVSIRVNEYQGNESLVAYATMTALYVPFGAAGTDTQAIDADAEEAADPMH
jgi:hypothetical protein